VIPDLTASLFSLPREVEIRWLGKRRMAMYTDRAGSVTDALSRYRENVYVTINELLPGAAERHGIKQDAIVVHPQRGQLTGNDDISRRLVLPFDSDPVRPTGVAATETQRQLAFEQSAAFERALCALGWPQPALVSTGNGACRYFACDLPADYATDALLRTFYACAAKKFAAPGVSLDTSVQNRGRVMRLPGSLNVKAGRRCEIAHLPETWRANLVTPEMLRGITEQWRSEMGFSKPRLVIRRGRWTEAHIEAFMHLHGMDYRPRVQIPAGVMWIVTCPFDEQHTGTSPAIILTNGGHAKWACKHHSCEMRWAQFAARLSEITGRFYDPRKVVSL
jgi:hypothetical protein